MKKVREKERRTRDIERIKVLRLLDDVFMKVVLKENIEGVQDIIRVILNRKDIVVLDVKTQDEYSNLVGHSVRIDVLARDAEGNYYNIEIQRSESGAGEKRARYNLGAVDWHTLPPGADYAELPETWIIFITETDLFGAGLSVYTINRYVEETRELFDDKGHILYVNGAYEGDDEIGLLMSDFRETDPKKMHYQSLAKKAQFFKNTEGGMTSMCRVMEDVRREGWEEGRIEGREEGRIEGREEGRVEGRIEGREEGREEGRVEGREEARIIMIATLLADNSADDLLHHTHFRRLHITQDEIDTARTWEEA